MLSMPMSNETCISECLVRKVLNIKARAELRFSSANEIFPGPNHGQQAIWVILIR
jgi:hypothetical protein